MIVHFDDKISYTDEDDDDDDDEISEIHYVVLSIINMCIYWYPNSLHF